MEIDEYLRVPWETSRIAFVTAPLGFGKTAFVRRMLAQAGQRFVEVDAMDPELASKLAPRAVAPYDAVVVDNLHDAQDAGLDISEACRGALASNPGTRFAFVSRAPMPGWLLQHFAYGEVLLVTRDDLWFSDADIAHQLCDGGLPASPSTVEGLARITRRYPFAVALAVRHLQGGMTVGQHLEELLVEETMLYFEGEFKRRFDERTQEAALAMALFDEVDDELLHAILPEGDARRLREALLRETNFIEPGDHGWRIIPGLREFCNWELRRRPREGYVEGIVDGAIRYYEGRNDYVSALELCRRGGYEERVPAILDEHARTAHDDGSYYALARYYRELPDEEVAQSLSMMRAVSLADAISLDRAGSERWYDELRRRADDSDEGAEVRRRAGSYVAYLDLVLPYRRVDDLAATFSAIAACQDPALTVPITGGAPSVLNGERDLSVWAADAEGTLRAVDGLLPAVLGRGAVGAGEVFLCESRFERGEDVSSQVLGISGLLPRIQREGSIAMEFAATGLLTRIRLDEGKPEMALGLTDEFRRRLGGHEGTEVARLARNLDALRCRVWLRQGKSDHVASWLERYAPAAQGALTYSDRYVYLTIALAHVARGEYDEALTLLATFDGVLGLQGNVLDGIDGAVMRAIVSWRRHEDSWRTQLGRALELSWRYGYVRPVARYGAAVLPMLLELQRAGDGVARAGDDGAWMAWLAALVRVARTQASHYPDFLAAAPGLAEPLTETETQVLRLLCLNKSNAEIGELLGIKLPTVKTHVSHILAKLGVRRRTQAADQARRLHLV